MIPSGTPARGAAGAPESSAKKRKPFPGIPKDREPCVRGSLSFCSLLSSYLPAPGKAPNRKGPKRTRPAMSFQRGFASSGSSPVITTIS